MNEKPLQEDEKERKILSTNQPVVHWHMCQGNATKWQMPSQIWGRIPGQKRLGSI